MLYLRRPALHPWAHSMDRKEAFFFWTLFKKRHAMTMKETDVYRSLILYQAQNRCFAMKFTLIPPIVLWSLCCYHSFCGCSGRVNNEQVAKSEFDLMTLLQSQILQEACSQLLKSYFGQLALKSPKLPHSTITNTSLPLSELLEHHFLEVQSEFGQKWFKIPASLNCCGTLGSPKHSFT